MNDTTSRADASRPSGRFLLRIDPRLHASLRAAARAAGLSLNEYCSRRLAAPGAAVADPAADAIEKASALLGEGLLGIVAYGSWARNELAEGSDVDLLMVVNPRIPITRDLYRRWDRAPLVWDSHAVEPHFVHAPPPDVPPSGTWAEAAVEGIVLFDPALVVSRRLAALRRQILAGRVVRRHAHGQPYWVGAA